MKVRLARISPVRTAWTASVIHAFLGAIMWVIMLIMLLVAQPEPVEGVSPFWGLLIALPIWVVLMPAVAFVAWVVIAWIYNLIARWTGGYEFNLKSLSR